MPPKKKSTTSSTSDKPATGKMKTIPMAKSMKAASSKKAAQPKGKAKAKNAAKKSAPKTQSSSKAKPKSANRSLSSKASAPPKVFFTLSKETTWAKWGKSGSNGIEECKKTFATKQEAAKHATKMLSYWEEDFDLEEDNRDSPPDDGVLITFENDCELEAVSIHKHVTRGQTASSSKAKPSADSANIDAPFYKLRLENGWSSGWGNSGMDVERCDKVFRTPKEAAAYAKNLIDCYEVFFEKDSMYGQVPVDRREDPPENGTLLQCIDEEGNSSAVSITKYNAGDDDIETKGSTSEEEEDEEVDHYVY